MLCTRLLTNSGELKANLSAIMKNLKVSLSSVLSYHIPMQEQRSSKAKRAQYGDNFMQNLLEIPLNIEHLQSEPLSYSFVL